MGRKDQERHLGGYYKFRDPGFQLLFYYGHTVVGQAENYAYLGLYWTWGNKKGNGDRPDEHDKPAGAAFNAMALFNTGLAWAKDAYPALNAAMKSVGGHHWTTHGLIDLGLFVGLGFAFTKTRVTQKMRPDRLIGILVGAVVVAMAGLALWYLFSG